MAQRIEIFPFTDSASEAVVQVSLRAWELAISSIEPRTGAAVYDAHHPDWRVSQRSTGGFDFLGEVDDPEDAVAWPWKRPTPPDER
jgi:hypothetical protein